MDEISAAIAAVPASRRRHRRHGGLTQSRGVLGRTPLVALLALVALVAVGSLLAGTGGEDGTATPGGDVLPGAPTLAPSLTPSAGASSASASATSPTPAAASGAVEPPSPSSSLRSPTTTATGLVTVRAGDYLGRPWRQARADLTTLGLQVRVTRTRSDADRGRVVAVRPTGQLRVGTVVTLVVSSG